MLLLILFAAITLIIIGSLTPKSCPDVKLVNTQLEKPQPPFENGLYPFNVEDPAPFPNGGTKSDPEVITISYDQFFIERSGEVTTNAFTLTDRPETRIGGINKYYISQFN